MVTGACCRRTSLCLRPSYHAGGGRAGADDRHRDEIELMELVKQRLYRIPRPRYHAGRGRTVAGVHHRAVCESGGGDDGYWSLLSAYWSLCLRPSYHAGGGRAGADDRHRAEIGSDAVHA